MFVSPDNDITFTRERVDQVVLLSFPWSLFLATLIDISSNLEAGELSEG